MKRPALAAAVCLTFLSLWAAAGVGDGVTLRELTADTATGQEVVYRTVGDRRLRLWVYAPTAAVPGSRAAVLVVIHGGGWAAPGPFRFEPFCRYFSRRGLAAVNVEYRLVSPGTGATNPAVRIADCISDCQSAVACVRRRAAEWGCDPDRIAVAGDSAGGHLAACTAILPPVNPDEASRGEEGRPHALILYNPAVGFADVPWLSRHWALPPESGSMTNLEARRAAVDPMAHIGPGLPPILLIHGTRDACIPVTVADRFAQLLAAAGGSCEYDRREGWTHAFAVPNYGPEATVVAAIRRTDEFLTRLGYLKGEPTLREEGGSKGEGAGQP